MATITDDQMKELVAAYDEAGNMPHGTMTHAQWLQFTGLYIAVGRIIDETGN